MKKMAAQVLHIYLFYLNFPSYFLVRIKFVWNLITIACGVVAISLIRTKPKECLKNAFAGFFWVALDTQ